MGAQDGKTSRRDLPTPIATANKLGLRWSPPGRGGETALTWDKVLDLAVLAYWRRRADVQAERGDGETAGQARRTTDLPALSAVR